MGQGVDDRALDPEGRFVWSANNEALVNFGKHRGRRLSEVAAGEPDYLEWIAGNPQFDTDTRDIAKNAVDGNMPVPLAHDLEGRAEGLGPDAWL